MNYKHILSGLSIALLLPLIPYYFFRYHPTQEVPQYQTSLPVRTSLTQYIQVSGTLEAEETIIVGSLIPGRVLEIHVDVNETVKKGDTLVILDDGIGTDTIEKNRALLRQRNAEYVFEEKQFKRKEALYQSQNLSEEAYDEALKTYHVAQSLLQQAEADLLAAEHAYEDRTIKAPTDGTVIARSIEVGQMVTAALDATQLFLIACDLKKMTAKIDIDEADVGKVQVGAPVSFYVDAFSTQEFTSTIHRINYQSKVVNSVVSYTAELAVSNPDLLLRPGMTVNVDIQVAKNENVLTVPLKALRVSDAAIEQLAQALHTTMHPLPEKETRVLEERIWILKENQLYEKKIKTGAQNRQAVAILEGITESDLVITAINETTENPLISQITKGRIGG